MREMVAAWWLGLLPLVFVWAKNAPKAFWWLAGAFAVSWLADAVTFFTVQPWWTSRVYVVSQSALVCAVFLSRPQALGLLVVLVCGGLCAIMLEPKGPEIPLHLVAWGLAAGIAEDEAPQPLKRALLAYFGLGSLVWLFYVALGLQHSWWLAYQGTRVVGISLFGYACWKPQPRLRAV